LPAQQFGLPEDGAAVVVSRIVMGIGVSMLVSVCMAGVLLVTALARCGRMSQAVDVCYQALSHAHKHGLDDTAHRQLQYDALSGNVPPAGPPGRPGRI
jgi:hypothetical protein